MRPRALGVKPRGLGAGVMTAVAVSGALVVFAAVIFFIGIAQVLSHD